MYQYQCPCGALGKMVQLQVPEVYTSFTLG